MRSLTSRETRLATLTGIVLVLGITYMFVQSQLAKIREFKQLKSSAQVEQIRQQNLLRTQPERIRELETIRGQLPRHPEGRDLKSEFAQQVQSLSSQSGLRLTGLNPENEEYLEELKLYQSSVRGSWSGSSEQLLSFLHRLHQLGAVSDMRELRIRNRSGMSDSLSGTFTLDFVYSRIPVSETNPTVDSTPQSIDDRPAP
ncbi:MAG: hypothetical protein PF795_04415 [Kiritimatiellae bacterium]|nr:hypothetical protein [Kiritimatiellia bacterium]